MKEYWNKLNLRERSYVLLGVTLFIVLIIYVGVWLPFVSRVNNLKQEVTAQQQLVNWMKQYKDELVQLRHMQPIIKQQANKSLLGIVEESLREKNISTSKFTVQQSKADEVQVSFSIVTFDALVTWINSLWQSSGIVIQQIAINPSDKAGVVKAAVVLAKAL